MNDELTAAQKHIRRSELTNKIVRYTILTIGAFIMIYPILWMVGASFKSNNEIFTEIGFIPKHLNFKAYVQGWNPGSGITFATYFINTFKIVIPKVVFTVISSVISAYGFARFEFPGKKILFSALMMTMFLPTIVTLIPMYLLFKNLGMLDTYWPLISPTIFATQAFFVFQLIQFLRSIPTSLDEAATMDGANSFQILYKVILPVIKPAIITCVIFQFVWSINDFMSPLIYLSTNEKFPVALALQMNMDTTGTVNYAQLMSMSVLAILPSIIVFFAAQKYFVDGVATTGIK
ncbi:carbohydrate ABC transporter permease [Lacticaseibacillus jixiensis]|uniref:carbohydrate ABC transporter permease n=1 Tax=Lacticaseibacillus jixiensis TaxID=3231926 RepID=UPI0036F21420